MGRMDCVVDNGKSRLGRRWLFERVRKRMVKLFLHVHTSLSLFFGFLPHFSRKSSSNFLSRFFKSLLLNKRSLYLLWRSTGMPLREAGPAAATAAATAVELAFILPILLLWPRLWALLLMEWVLLLLPLPSTGFTGAG